MHINTKIEYPEFIYELSRQTDDDNFDYIYRGTFTSKISDSILSLAERNLRETSDPLKIRRRVYFIMVESLQNITRYQAHNHDLDKTAIFIIQKRGDLYLITSGNLIENSKIDYVRGQLNQVNSLEKSELKAYYKRILDNGRFTNEGGAGLGLIEMVRKSGNKLTFDFRPINDEFSFFYLHTYITNRPKSEIPEQPIQRSGYTLAEITALHKMFISQKISLVFSSGYTRDGLMKFLFVVEKQITNINPQCKENFQSLIYILQEFIDESNTGEESPKKTGIFLIKELIDSYIFNIGLYIPKEKTNHFKQKILENAAIWDSNRPEENQTSYKPIIDFRDIDSNVSFFDLQFSVIKTLKPNKV